MPVGSNVDRKEKSINNPYSRNTNHLVGRMESQGEVSSARMGDLPQNVIAGNAPLDGISPDTRKEEQFRKEQEQTLKDIHQDHETPTNVQLPIKELLKQAFKTKVQNFVNQTFSEFWSSKEKAKMVRATDAKGKKKIQRHPSTDPYTVEFPEEDQDMIDANTGQNSNEEPEEELARKINSCLHLKRKREEDDQLFIEDGGDIISNTHNLQLVLKRRKDDTTEEMAEEAGPSVPPPIP
ncbi:hypothetical protein PIB30_068490 [Stylosanthes scabra]|uniref:Uncharacterized protein n=1 Tax=Stylosanthes scabra TaxID=79078 RepID=A0ABU6SN31_9FABA|nr:hypothetical protein [Stylosanthes scabra]